MGERNLHLERIKELIWERPGINALEVEEATGIPIEVISQFIDDGDLAIMPGAVNPAEDFLRGDK
jgi:hypothetical protein